MRLTLDPDSGTGLRRQIIIRLRELIDGGVLARGDRLPSSRALAASLGVSRHTVTGALQELWAQGYLELRPGAAPRVRGAAQPSDRLNPDATRPPETEAFTPRFGPAAEAVADLVPAVDLLTREPPPGTVDFARFNLDARLFPVDDWRRSLDRQLNDAHRALFNYTHPAGVPALRQAIAARMTLQGVNAHAGEILVTNGSLQGLALVTQLLAGPGRTVLVESPTFSSVLPLVAAFGAQVRGVPMRPSGMDLDALERMADDEGQRAAFLYSIPSFHNPTGITTDRPHRERLLAICDKFGLPLVEDCFEEELRFFDKVVPPVKSLDRRGMVLYLGTFSKILFPGLRIGWIAAGKPFVDRLTALKMTQDVCSGGLLQAALADFMERGAFERHVCRMNRHLARRTRAATRAITELWPVGASPLQRPSGGCLLWLRLPPTAPEDREIAERCLAHGVRVLPGRLFYPEPPAVRHLRLALAALDDEEIREGLARLRRAWDEL